ncbi:MAG: CHAT domain-containing tetratricopeptide repeat protein [Gammaproteobacteria bacterium]
MFAKIPIAVLALFAGDAALGACDPLLAERAAMYETTVAVQGREPSSRTVRVPAGAEVLVLAREVGLNVTVGVTLDKTTLGLADSPIERSGIQHLLFTSGRTANYFITLTGSEDTQESGRVQLRVLTLAPRTAEDQCLRLQRALAAADADYAYGKAVNRGTLTATEGTAAAANSPPPRDAPTAFEAAAKAYKAIATDLAAEGPTPLKAFAEHALAAVYYEDIGDYSESVKWSETAAQTYSSLGDEYGTERATELQAAALMELAVSPAAHASKADAVRAAAEGLARARTLLTSVAKAYVQSDKPRDQASALNYIGLAYYYEGQNDQAIGAYKKALSLYESLGAKLRQAQLLQNVAVAEYELGRLSGAIARYSQVLDLIRGKDDAAPLIFVLNNSAIANWASGNFDAALREHGEALQMARATQIVGEQARSLQGLGSVYDSIGDRAQALEYFNQALALRPAATDGRRRTTTLRSIASVLREQGRFRDAQAMHREALSLASTPTVVARIRVQLAKDLVASGDLDAASKELETVLHESTEDDPVRAQALLERSRLRALRNDDGGAQEDLRSALKTFRAYEDAADEFSAWIELAKLKRRQGAFAEAFNAVDKALALAEEVRLQSANPELRASLMQPLRPAFDLKLSMLGAQYTSHVQGARSVPAATTAMEALITAEQARARALADIRRLDLTAPGVSPQQAQARQTLYRELAGRRFQLEARLDRSGTQDNRVKLLRTEIAGIRQQLDQIDAQIGAASNEKERAGGANRKSIDLSAIPADTAIVEYWLGVDEAVAWVATRERLQMVELGPTARVTAAAMAFHEALRSFGSVPMAKRLSLGEALYALTVRPMAETLADKRQIVFAPDGALHYVPFAALRYVDGGRARFLIERHDIAVASSVETLLENRPPVRNAPPRKQMLLVDDPVYGLDDSRLAIAAVNTTRSVTRGTAPSAKRGTTAAATSSVMRGFPSRPAIEGLHPWPRLPATQQEADTISSLIPSDQIDRLEGFTATRERFLGAGLGQYRFIHVASHAVADSEIPQLSALILTSRDAHGLPIEGRVLAADFVSTQLNADAVVLSACDTALGKNMGGEGLVGLRYVVLARGAKSVLASLWPVPDQAAAQLMTRFYSSLLRGGSTVTVASSEAMRGMLAGPYKDPALWAAFALAIGPLRTE